MPIGYRAHCLSAETADGELIKKPETGHIPAQVRRPVSSASFRDDFKLAHFCEIAGEHFLGIDNLTVTVTNTLPVFKDYVPIAREHPIGEDPIGEFIHLIGLELVLLDDFVPHRALVFHQYSERTRSYLAAAAAESLAYLMPDMLPAEAIAISDIELFICTIVFR